MERHHKALARLAKLEGRGNLTIVMQDGKTVQNYVYGLTDGKVVGKVAGDLKSEVVTIPADKSGKGEKHIILHVSPDAKYETVPDAKYETVHKKIVDLKDGKEKP